MIRQGTDVKWKRGRDYAVGTVSERHESTVSRYLSGTDITRHGSPEDPALVIVQDDGSRVLKLAHEVEPDNAHHTHPTRALAHASST